MPKTRADCKNAVRPCPFIRCKWHLAIDVSPSGTVKENFPGMTIDEMPETCALDVADKGEHSAEYVAVCMNRTRSAIDFTVNICLDKLRDELR